MDEATSRWAAGRLPGWTITVASTDAPSMTADAAADLAALDERALVRACLERRAGAFDQVVVRYRRSVYQLCYRFVGNHEDATDLAQDVFLRAYRALGHFKGEAAMGTWLYRIATNVCLNRIGRRVPRTESLDEHRPLPTGEPDAASRLIGEERAARVRCAVSRLPRKQRATLILRIYQDLSHRDIARVLGTSVGAAKANLFHALKNLRKQLDGEPL